MPLTEYPIEDLPSLLRGALGVERTATGVVPVRLPDWAWREVPEDLAREAFRQSSGVRLGLVTEATTLELDVAATRLTLDGFDESTPMQPVAVDLFVDGEEQAGRTLESIGERRVNLERDLVGESEADSLTLRFDGLVDTDKYLEVWLPAGASVELRALRADAPLRPSPDERPCWIHYGSSISHCSGALRPSQTWPAVASRLGGLDLLNLGVDGNCHLDPFVARAIRDTPAACISLKIGINIAARDTLKYRTFVPAIHGFLDTVRDGHPDTPVLLVSPIICPMLEESPGPLLPGDDGGVAVKGDDREGKNALSLRRIREILEEVVGTRSTNDGHLHYLNGLHLFGEGELAELPDGVHPSPAGYIQIGERFAQLTFGVGGCFAEVRAPSPAATGAG